MDLYEVREGKDVRYLDASICDDKLRISGHDIGPSVEKIFGEDEYEFWHEFSVENTKKLQQLFNTDDLLEALKEYFDNRPRLTDFYLLCAENNIKYSTHNWF